MLSSKILSYPLVLVFIIANLLYISLMAEFHGIFCCPFLLSVLLIEGVGGMDGGVGWGGVGWVARQGRVGWMGWEVAKITIWDSP